MKTRIEVKLEIIILDNQSHYFMAITLITKFSNLDLNCFTAK